LIEVFVGTFVRERGDEGGAELAGVRCVLVDMDVSAEGMQDY
jgi:hypothetical protein